MISVIVPVRERRQYLHVCLSSILQVVGTPLQDQIEILVQDNASPSPGMQEVVGSILGELVPWSFERNARDLGCYASVNKAIRRSHGTWIHVLHDDDWVLPDFYPTVAGVIDELGMSPIAAGGICTLYATKNEMEDAPPGPDWQPEPFAPSRGLVNLADRLIDGNLFQSCAVIFSREAFEHMGPFREDLPYTADWEYWLRMSLWRSWVYVPEVLAYYRQHMSNLTHNLTQSGETASCIRRTLETFAKLVPPEKHGLLQKARLSQSRHLVQGAYMALEAGHAGLGRHYLLEAAEVLKS
jgi:glycosyltransferase involved in cell wall biosynthesis